MKKQQAVDLQLKSTWHNMFKMYNQAASKYGTTQATGLVLLTIEKEGTPSTSIAPALGMEATSLTRIIKTLEEKKMIFKQRDKKDKRLVRIFLTPEGVEKRKLAKKVVSGFNELIKINIPQEKIDLFLDIMSDIDATIDEYRKLNEMSI